MKVNPQIIKTVAKYAGVVVSAGCAVVEALDKQKQIETIKSLQEQTKVIPDLLKRVAELEKK